MQSQSFIGIGYGNRACRSKVFTAKLALAFEARSNRTYISDVERGTRNPSIEVVQRIANALGVTMGELLDDIL